MRGDCASSDIYHQQIHKSITSFKYPITYTFAESDEFAEVCGDESHKSAEQLLNLAMLKGVLCRRALAFVKVCSLISHSHQVVKEYKEMTAHILSHLVRSFSLKIISDIAFKPVYVLES